MINSLSIHCTLIKAWWLTVVMLCCVGCGSDSETGSIAHKDSTTKNIDSIVPTSKPDSAGFATGLEIEPRIKKTDSLEILFFDNPDGDSLRYTRFYKYVTSGDTVFNHLVISNLDRPFTKVPVIKDCRSEGKIYMHAGENPVKTLYFSTRGDSCSYIYMISNGAFLYFDLDETVKSNLKSMKKMARKP